MPSVYFKSMEPANMLYMQLLVHEIRLITIQPSQHFEEQVECTLDHFDITEQAYTDRFATAIRELRTILQKSDPEQERGRSLSSTCSLRDELFRPVYEKALRSEEESEAYKNAVYLGEDPEQHTYPNDGPITLPEFRYSWGDYIALSYTWGDPANIREILVNGRKLEVTQNVDAMLKTLRSKSYIKRGWKVWIDAICINQKDLRDRSSQVQKMHEIYTRAWTPIVWLGEMEEDTATGLDLLASLADDYSSEDGAARLTATLHRNPEHFGKHAWRGLHEVLCRPYWRRLWVLQEVACGGRTMPVLCGDRTLLWHQFSTVFNLLRQTDEVRNTYIKRELDAALIALHLEIWADEDTVRSSIPAFKDIELISTPPNMYPLVINADEIIDSFITDELKAAFIPFNPEIDAYLNAADGLQTLQESQLAGVETNLFSLLNLSRSVLATDPRDKIYGLLGLIDRSLASRVKLDYSQSLLDVYRSFTLLIIDATGSLDIIRHSTTDSSMPLWVPNWTVAPAAATLTSSETTFSTSGTSRASIKILLPDQSLLSCKGFIIDYFDGTGAMWATGWTTNSITPSTSTANPYKTLAATRDAIWRSLVANHASPDKLLKSDDPRYGDLLATPALADARDSLPQNSLVRDIVDSNVFSWCVRSLRANASFRVAGLQMADYFLDKESSGAELAMRIDAPSLRQALMQKDRVGVQRKLATTERGFVGLVNDRVERGDMVAVLKGCSVPFVLRKTRKVTENVGVTWQVLGECYLHGVMNGEALGWGLEEEDIVLS